MIGCDRTVVMYSVVIVDVVDSPKNSATHWISQLIFTNIHTYNSLCNQDDLGAQVCMFWILPTVKNFDLSTLSVCEGFMSRMSRNSQSTT